MPDGVTFKVSELERDRRILERKLRNYSKPDEDLYNVLNFYLELAIENIDELRDYTHIRINRNGISIPSRVPGTKGARYSTYVAIHLT